MGKIAKIVETQFSNTIEGMLNASGTNWDAKLVPARLSDSPSPATGGFNAIVRGDSGTPLAFVSERFRPNSHRQQLQALSPLVESGLIKPASVSMWDNGAILAYQFSVPSLEIAVGGTDKVSHLLTLMYSYGFKVADMAFVAGFRAFCKNQMGAFARLAGDDKVRHRGDVVGKYADILRKRISELTGEVQERGQLMAAMGERMLTAKATLDYIGQSIGVTQADVERAYVSTSEELHAGGPSDAGPRRILDVIDCYKQDNCGAEGSVWHAYNAVTRYTTHKYGKNDASRMRSVMMGQGAAVNARAWQLASNITSGQSKSLPAAVEALL